MAVELICMSEQIVSKNLHPHLQTTLAICLASSSEFEDSAVHELFLAFLNKLPSMNPEMTEPEGIIRTIEEFMVAKNAN
jgi:hypothetical protein